MTATEADEEALRMTRRRRHWNSGAMLGAPLLLFLLAWWGMTPPPPLARPHGRAGAVHCQGCRRLRQRRQGGMGGDRRYHRRPVFVLPVVIVIVPGVSPASPG